MVAAVDTLDSAEADFAFLGLAGRLVLDLDFGLVLRSRSRLVRLSPSLLIRASAVVKFLPCGGRMGPILP